MKQLLLLLISFLICTYGIAQSSNLSQDAKFLHSLSSAWKTKQSIHLEQFKNDINMGYGGADISRRPTIIPHITTA